MPTLFIITQNLAKLARNVTNHQIPTKMYISKVPIFSQQRIHSILNSSRDSIEKKNCNLYRERKRKAHKTNRRFIGFRKRFGNSGAFESPHDSVEAFTRRKEKSDKKREAAAQRWENFI